MGPTKGEVTRARIVEAAWELSAGRGVEAVLGGVSLREVAAAVGLSPSAVAYHFPTMQDLAVAMVEHHCGSISPLPYHAVEALLALARREGMVAALRGAASANWELVTSAEEAEYERRLTRCYSVTGAAHGGAEVATRLAELQASWVQEFATIYQQTADAMGLAFVEPFTVHDIALAMSALSQGLLDHWICDPRSVRPDLLADISVAVASSVIVSRERPVALAEVSVALPARAEVSSSDDMADDMADDMRVAVMVAPLFHAGVDVVTLTEVGATIGSEADEVAARFGTLRRLAATSFCRHLERVRAAATRRAEAPASVRLADAVCELARAAQDDPHCATALLVERVESRATSPVAGGFPDVHLLVPVAAALSAPLSELSNGPETQRDDLADLLVDTVLGYAAGHPRTALSTIAALALRLIEPSGS